MTDSRLPLPNIKEISDVLTSQDVCTEYDIKQFAIAFLSDLDAELSLSVREGE